MFRSWWFSYWSDLISYRFKPAVEELLKSVKGTEGEILVRVLLEDIEMRLSGLDYFVLG